MNRAMAIAALTLCAGLAAAAASAAETSGKADLAKGQATASTICAACHGADGNSPTPVNPKLAGQGAEYLAKQLRNFMPADGKKPERENPIMGGMAASLSPDDIRNVTAYFETQKAKPGAARGRDTAALGQKIYRGGDMSKGLPACASCHGPNGAGIPIQYPRLAGQYMEYTEAQLKAFRSGQRANDLNKMMRTIASRMSDAEIRAVSDYIAGLH
jgi:cytochrome c553